jgi:oxalate---CoA ligase
LKLKTTLAELLSIGADQSPAIGAPGQLDINYKNLRSFVSKTSKILNDIGIGRNDRVAIVLDNGPEMALAYLSVASCSTSAPLNAGYRAEEFEFYLEDLKAKALIVKEGVTSPSFAVAEKLGLAILELHLTPDQGAGTFTLNLKSKQKLQIKNGGPSQAEDLALILHTSGTTSRPKIVPLSQANVCASASHIANTLALTSKDRALNIMPLFHIHGLIAGILAPLSKGGYVSCTPGFNALKFFSWMSDIKPTWYTAVPTMHQAILARAPQNRSVIESNPLRFLRSSSAAMPMKVIEELEACFKAPLIESYGMTEASHQMASNLLPPAKRKPGTVGVAAGPKMGIMNEAGKLLQAGETGEIVIQGPNVTKGYENNPKANAENFTNGWFRTGDQGSIDNEGYISITGRLKEIINRGGEKISPREVDEILMEFPAVAQVVTFAIPHDKLGEEVGAVVVLKEGKTATEREIRDFAEKRLANFKVPKKIIFKDEIPKGATGKLQRIGLAAKLGL